MEADANKTKDTKLSSALNMSPHPTPTTIKNLQANAICEHIHQTVGSVLCILCHIHHPQNMLQASDSMD
jgi:hypothetical protein